MYYVIAITFCKKVEVGGGLNRMASRYRLTPVEIVVVNMITVWFHRQFSAISCSVCDCYKIQRRKTYCRIDYRSVSPAAAAAAAAAVAAAAPAAAAAVAPAGVAADAALACRRLSCSRHHLKHVITTIHHRYMLSLSTAIFGRWLVWSLKYWKLSVTNRLHRSRNSSGCHYGPSHSLKDCGSLSDMST